MSLRHKIGGLVSAVALAAGLSTAIPSYAVHRHEPAKGDNVYSEENTRFPVLPVVIDDSLPHYLKGVRRISKDVKDYQIHRWMENFRVHTTSTLEHQTGPNFNFVNQAASFSEKIHGRDVRFVLQDYMIANKRENGKNKQVLFYNGTGGVREFPMDEFGKIKKDLVYRIRESANRNAKQFGGIFGDVKTKLAKRQEMTEEEFEKQVEELVTLRGGVKVRKGAFLDYPGKDIEAKDFVPNTVVFGNHSAQKPGNFLYAAVVVDSGIMYLTPLSLKLEYISNGLSITRHEQIHTNRKMQNFTLNNMMDVELFAAFPWLDESVPQSKMNFGYMRSIRETIKTYMCFDMDQAKKEIMTGLFGVPTFKTDEATLKKFRKYAQWIDSAKSTLKKATRNALVEFYSDPSWFGTLNEKLDYPRAGFDLLMSQQLEPTCLGGPKKTLEWIAENTGKIDSLWKKALEELEKNKRKRKEDSEKSDLVGNPSLEEMFNTFRVIRNQGGQKMAENYLLDNIDELVPYLGILSGGNLQLLKDGLRLRDIETQRKVLRVLDKESLRKQIGKQK